MKFVPQFIRHGRQLHTLLISVAGFIVLGTTLVAYSPDAAVTQSDTPLLAAIGGAKANDDLDVTTSNTRNALSDGESYDKSGRREAISELALDELFRA